MARANVPKFGNWESEESVPYTVYFDKARKNKGGKMINPNDPQENSEMFAPSLPPPAATRTPPRYTNEPNGSGAVRPNPDHRKSREEGDLKQFANSPGRSEMGQRNANESNYGGRGQRPDRSSRPSVGSDQSFDHSPLHLQHQAKVVGNTGSPALEGKNHDNGHGVAGKSRLKPNATRGDESPEKGAAVPRFGAWDENNPESAENFTHIFNKVREERNAGPAPGSTPKHPSHGPRSQQSDNPKKSCFCFW